MVVLVAVVDGGTDGSPWWYVHGKKNILDHESWIERIFFFEWFILLEIQHDKINVKDVDI